MKVESEAPAASTPKKAVTKKRKASTTMESGKKKKVKATPNKKKTKATSKKKKAKATPKKKKAKATKKKLPKEKKKQPSTLLKLKLGKELVKVEEKQKAMGLNAEEPDYPGLLRMQQAFIRRYRRLETKIAKEDEVKDDQDFESQTEETEDSDEGSVKAIKYANRLLRIEMRWVVDRIKHTETLMTELVEAGKAFVIKRTPKGSEKVVETFKYLDSAKNRELGRVGKEYTREFYETVEEERVQLVMKPASGSKPAKVPFKKFKKNKKVSSKKLDSDGNPIKGEPGPWIKALNEAKEDLKKQGHDVPRFMKCRSTLEEGATEMNKLEHTLWILAKEIMTRNKQNAEIETKN